MRDDLKRLIEKADIDDEASLHVLALALQRSGFPKQVREFVPPSRADVIHLGPETDYTCVVVLLEATGEPIEIPDDAEATVLANHVHIRIPGRIG